MHFLITYSPDGYQNHIYTVMQSDGNTYCGDVVLDSFYMVYSDEDSI